MKFFFSWVILIEQLDIHVKSFSKFVYIFPVNLTIKGLFPAFGVFFDL